VVMVIDTKDKVVFVHGRIRWNTWIISYRSSFTGLKMHEDRLRNPGIFYNNC